MTDISRDVEQKKNRTRQPAGAAKRRTGWVGGVTSAAAFGLTPTVAAFAYDGGVSPTVLVLLRSIIGGVLLLSVAAATGRLITVPWRTAVILTFVCGPLFGVQLLCFFAAIELTGAQVAVVIAHVSPVFVLAFSVLVLRKRLGVATWSVCGVMVAGVSLVAGAGDGGGVKGLGVLLAVTCAATYAAYYLLGEKHIRRVSVLTATAFTSIGSALTAGVIVLVRPQYWDFTAAGWTSVGIQGLLMVPLGIGGAYVALRVLGSVPGSLLSLLEPIVGVFAAQVFLSEKLFWPQWIGVTLVLLATGLLPWSQSRRPSQRPSGDSSSTPPVATS